MHDVLEGIALPPDTNQPMLRYYEVTGMPHLRMADLGTQHREFLAGDVGKGDDPQCQTLYDEPVEVVAAALLNAMDKWVRTGQPMPKAPRVGRQGNGVVRDGASRNMIGGVRPPWIMVPSATYLTEQETNCGLVYDTKLVLPADQLRQLYSSYRAYVKKFEAAKRTAIRQGYLLKADAESATDCKTSRLLRGVRSACGGMAQSSILRGKLPGETPVHSLNAREKAAVSE